MAGKAAVSVKIIDNYTALSVKCVIAFEAPVREFSFSLSTLLPIDSITSDVDVKWRIAREWQPRWQHKSNAYEVSGEAPMREISIAYHGQVSGWCNIIEERRTALSAYSAWTISETSVPLAFLFKVESMENYFILNARYDETEKLWIYGETGHEPGNIIALKKECYDTVRRGDFSFYFLEDAERAYAESYAYYYEDIIRYYLSLFPPKNISKMNVVSLGLRKGGGAYFRKELMVIERLKISRRTGKMKNDVISLLAHELGHHWFTGEDATTWENWLSETGAEWAALLYLLSIGNHRLFRKKIRRGKLTYRRTPVIKPPDLARPTDTWGVHIRGVMLFYEIYRKHGKETVLKLLRILAGQATTENFLADIRAQMGEGMARLIERNLTVKEYIL